MKPIKKYILTLAGIFLATTAMNAFAEIKPYKLKRIAGSTKNPVYRTVVPYGTRSIHQGLHRGRVVKTYITRNGSNINVHSRFENHKKTRGWHLTNEVVFLDKNGRALKKVLHEKVAIKEKGFGGFRVENRKTDISHVNGIAFVRVTSFRQADGRFLEKTLNAGLRIYEALKKAQEVYKNVQQERSTGGGRSNYLLIQDMH